MSHGQLSLRGGLRGGDGEEEAPAAASAAGDGVDVGELPPLHGDLPPLNGELPLEDFVWSEEFGKTFDPLFMTGMTPEQEKEARDEFIKQIMDGDEDLEQLQDHWRKEGNKKVAIAHRLKSEGNENHTKFHRHAVKCYTSALLCNSSDVLLRAVCHANRANSHLATSNFGHAIRDCNATVAMFEAVRRGNERTDYFEKMPAGWQRSIRALDAEGMTTLRRVALKCMVRAASACLQLERFAAAITYCQKAQDLFWHCDEDEGGASEKSSKNKAPEKGSKRGRGLSLQGKDAKAEPIAPTAGGEESMAPTAEGGDEMAPTEGGGDDMAPVAEDDGLMAQVKAIWDESEQGLKDQAAEQETAQRLREEARARRFTVDNAVRKSGVLMGVTLYPEVLKNQLVDVQVGETFAGGWSEAGWVAGGGDLYWPLLVMYQQFQQTDFLRQCAEDSSVRQHLETVFDPLQPPPPWDPARTHTASNVAVYYISYQVPLRVRGQLRWLEEAQGGRRCRKKWIRVNVDASLKEVLRAEGHVVPGFPVLHIVLDGGAWQKNMLQRPCEDFVDPPSGS